MKLIEYQTNNVIGKIELNFLPRIKEKIFFNNNIYSIYEIIHSESEVILIVFVSNNNPIKLKQKPFESLRTPTNVLLLGVNLIFLSLSNLFFNKYVTL